MKIVTDLTVSSRPLRVGTSFAPWSLFSEGARGTFWSAAFPDAVFADSAASIPAQFGQSVAKVTTAPELQGAEQISAALRPTFGRAPLSGRRNLLLRTEDIANSVWNKVRGTVAPLGEAEWAFTESETYGVHQIHAGPFFDAGVHCLSVDLRANMRRRVTISFRQAGSFHNNDGATVDLIDGSLISQSSGNYTITSVGDGWWRVSIQRFGNQSGSLGVSLSAAPDVASDHGDESQHQYMGDDSQVAFHLRRPQLEAGDTQTPYQRVGNAFDVTEEGSTSPAFIRFDLSDDFLQTTFVDGGSFDVMIFGRQGSWSEPAVTVPLAGSLNIGPTSITGGSAGLLEVLGDLVGWLAIDRALTNRERDRLLDYHIKLGANNLLENI